MMSSKLVLSLHSRLAIRRVLIGIVKIYDVTIVLACVDPIRYVSHVTVTIVLKCGNLIYDVTVVLAFNELIYC